MSKKIPSKYQVAIYNEYETTNNNLFIGASAGSGKTFTLLQLLEKTPFHKKSIMVAFNKSIAEELKTKVPIGVDVSTIHSLGFKILRKGVFSKFKLSEIKTFILAKELLSKDESLKKLFKSFKKFNAYLFTISKLYDLYRLNLADKSINSLQALANEYNVDILEASTFESTSNVIDYIEGYNNRDHREMMIDFTDMLWLPYKKIDKAYYPKYNVVMCDEVQDVNPLQKVMILNTVKPNGRGRTVFVGDEKQAIYSFMGSNLKSFNELQNLPNTTVLPLSVSYRCGVNIVAFANKIFDGMEAFEGNPEGVIRKGTFKDIEIGDMTLCRNNQPLIESWLELTNLGKKSHIMGRDFGKTLQNIINSVESVEELMGLLVKKLQFLEAKGIENPHSHKSYVSLKEKIDIILLLMDKKDYTMQEVSDLFNVLFSDKVDRDNSITLSTIHKSKGLESRRIFIIGYHSLMPSPYAKSELEKRQEECLKYVAATRAIEELIFIDYIPNN